MSGLQRIGTADIEPIALGATLLGTGGGGDPHVGALTARRLIRERGEVPVRPAESLTAEDFVVPIGMIGAPSVANESIASLDEFTGVLDALREATGRVPTALMPIEIGGGNSLVPIAAAAAAGLPVVDADAMGRAFPEAQMVTFHLAGYGPGTAAMVDHLGNRVVLDAVSGPWSERLARAVTVEMGGTATMCDYAYPGDVTRECAIPGTLSLAHSLGKALTDNDVRGGERLQGLLRRLDGHLLFEGKIVHLDRRFSAGFTRGEAQLEGLGDHRGQELTIRFQNEFLIAHRDGALAAVTPDLIAVLDQVTSAPVTTENLAYGARVHVIAMPCDERWRTPRGIAEAGPAHFGYQEEYRPVEELAGTAAMSTRQEAR
ncbi:DUF917 domain-containing protein [Sediminivirga luteola]|uniref:DUF917 domain-containing protein n=1 Tax=Sediminivirga luteola TaxID=1774748 RepID=A0A8J2TZK3_9MICO|nr:DUF917 domain-containing protein [Sediminivirga luteola]GGA20828.1 hypothetical protein GCM10011333_24910 [Sediminivirga luteola]